MIGSKLGRRAPPYLVIAILALFAFGVHGCGPDASRPSLAPSRVELRTSVGVIRLELDSERAPVTIDNFKDYVNSGFYDGTLFHRVVPGFVIQGGGFTDGMVAKDTRDPIISESRNGLQNLRGTIGMARTSNPNSATSQFYINLKDNTMLDYPRPDGVGYTVFGQVIEGMAVVDSIARVETHAVGQFQGVPVVPVVILSAVRI